MSDDLDVELAGSSYMDSVSGALESTKESLEHSLDTLPGALPSSVTEELDEYNIHLVDKDGNVNRTTTFFFVLTIVIGVVAALLGILSGFCCLEARRKRIIEARRRAVRAMMNVEDDAVPVQQSGTKLTMMGAKKRGGDASDRVPLAQADRAADELARAEELGLAHVQVPRVLQQISRSTSQTVAAEGEDAADHAGSSTTAKASKGGTRKQRVVIDDLDI